MLTWQHARDELARLAEPKPPLTLDLADALHCRLAGEVRSDIDLPSADIATMDGYAVRAAELQRPGVLPVAFEVPAGATPLPLPPGSAARIFTGAVMPAGADAVIPQEHAEREPDGRVRLPTTSPGRHVRPRGELARAGEPVAHPGERITPQRAALLAAVGAARVSVVPRPRLAVLATGSELVGIDEIPAPGQVRNSNATMIEALARQAHLPCIASHTACDDLPALTAALADLVRRADLVLTIGGVSVGDYDLVPKAVETLGGRLVFHRVATRPGKPTLVARIAEAWLVGLPGNPLSALVGWCLYARPLAETLAGDTDALRRGPLAAVLTAPATNHAERTLLAPATVDAQSPTRRVTPITWKGPHDLTALARTRALLVLEPGVDLAPGDTVQCWLVEPPEPDSERPQ